MTTHKETLPATLRTEGLWGHCGNQGSYSVGSMPGVTPRLYWALAWWGLDEWNLSHSWLVWGRRGSRVVRLVAEVCHLQARAITMAFLMTTPATVALGG